MSPLRPGKLPKTLPPPTGMSDVLMVSPPAPLEPDPPDASLPPLPPRHRLPGTTDPISQVLLSQFGCLAEFAKAA